VTDSAPTLETGNATEAGASSRGWFVGDLAAWATSRGEALHRSSTPRQSADVQVKWFVHPPGHARQAWADPDGCFSLGVVVDGDMHFAFRAHDGSERTIHLMQRGDYVIWHGPSYHHSWRTEGGCTFLTVRWSAFRR